MRSAHATPQLVQLRQAEALGMIDDDGVRGWNIQPTFDDGGADSI
jgi:hypothetical protein